MKNTLLCATMLAAAAPAWADIPAPPAAVTLVTGAVDETRTVAFPGDLSSAVARSNDGGEVDGSLPLPSIRMTLKRPPALQEALDTLTRNQHIRGSAEFRQWLKPTDLRAYGPAQADIDKVTAWLKSRGLTVNEVSSAGMWIDFGGTAAAVSAAFHTSLHNLTLGSERHIANIRPPAIPAALAPVVAGVTLHNFFPRPMMQRVTPNYTVNTSYGPFQAVGAQDFATIYNVTPLRSSNNFYGAPITGAGVTIAVIEQSLIRKADWNRFRAAFGLSGYTGTLTQINPQRCQSPGLQPDEGEAAIDAEWSTAVAPDANILLAACSATSPYNFGVLTALTNLVERGSAATIYSISYGGQESANGYAFVQNWNNQLQMGAAEGTAIFVSTGDQGVSADRGSIDAKGLFVNGLADSAYNVAVGGTDFYDTALGQTDSYWKKGNAPGLGSAKSYIPEIPWNNSCAGSILRAFAGGGSAIQFCNTNPAGVQNGIGGSGSQSQYFTKPDWQLTSLPGMPNDNLRDQPDVSLFAANGLWGHFYLYCMSDQNQGGAPCQYAGNNVLGNAAGGTSFAAPAFAGITALIQETFGPGAKLGNPAPEFYIIGQAQYTTALGLSQCNSSQGNKISTACVFNNVTAGDNAQPCYKGTPDCAANGDATMGIGVLKATVGGKSIVAYPAQPGYSLATGLGTVNVTNLLYSYY
jgi:subtilase family serine protease